MPELTFTRLAGSSGSDRLLIVGPSLGTSVEALWDRAATALGAHAEVVGWDLPGHGRSVPATEPFSIADLADAVRRNLDELAAGRPTSYAGVSLGGAVGLQLAFDPGIIDRVVCIASAAKHGERAQWVDRAALVRRAGTAAMVAPSVQRWFADGFVEREPAVADRLLLALSDADGESYAVACEALADFDVCASLGGVRSRLIVVAGAHDVAMPVESARSTAHAADAMFVVLPGCAHLPPAEDPDAVAALLTDAWEVTMVSDTYDEGRRVRREVLGEEYVDRAEARDTAFTADFQELITRYGWGGVWARPGLDRRTRSVATLTALLALRHWEEFAMHVRAARRNGLSADEIAEVILQSAIYCGVPVANHGFSVAKGVLDAMEQLDD